MKSVSKSLESDKHLILLFHGVIPNQRHEIRNYTSKHITRDDFISILNDLKRAGGVPLSMDDVIDHHKTKKPWPSRSYSITFDDGFENNYRVAAPILDEYKIPSMFYVTTSFIENNSSSWIDQIEYAFEIEPSINIQIPEINENISVSGREQKIECLDRIRKKVKNDRDIDPYKISQSILDQNKIRSIDSDKDLDQKMNWKQLQELNQSDLFNIGGHGHTHRILSHLNSNDLNQEIKTSIQLMKDNLNKQICHYSYPEGLKSHFSPAVIEVLKKYGVQCCPSAETGTNSIGDNIFELKRVMVQG